jgi:hypothetical protein
VGLVMTIEIQPATLGQVKRSSRGQLVEITQDVTNVAQRLQEIDPDLKLLFDEDQCFYIVRHDVARPDGSVDENLVLTSQQLGSHIVERVRQISSAGYDYVRELEQMEDAARKQRDHEVSERQGPILEQLSHALRKDLGLRSQF